MIDISVVVDTASNTMVWPFDLNSPISGVTDVMALLSPSRTFPNLSLSSLDSIVLSQRSICLTLIGNLIACIFDCV